MEEEIQIHSVTPWRRIPAPTQLLRKQRLGWGQMPRTLLKEMSEVTLLCMDLWNQRASLWLSMCFSISVSRESRQKRQKANCFITFSVRSFLLMLIQVLSSLGWEVTSISGTELLGISSITPGKFYLDCNMKCTIKKLVSFNEDNIIKKGKHISFQLSKTYIFPFVQYE